MRFYFDYISPNAYLAWTQLPALAARHGFDIEPVPVLFAALLEAHGQLGPAEVPAKIRWMFKNTLRKAAVLGVPLNPPAFHPFNPLVALRVSSLPLAKAERSALVDALFQAVWVRGLHVGDPAVVERVADEIGLSGAALVAGAQQAECKRRLRAETDGAIARGVFGVPTMEVGDELFWGYDDFPYLELFLAGKDPLAGSASRDWSTGSRPSAVRATPGSAASRNRELVRRFYEELWNRFDKTRIGELLTDDVAFRGSLGQETRGHDGFAAYMDVVQRAFPDFTNDVQEIVAEKDRAFARLVYRGTHRGEVLGVPPTGRAVEYAGAALFGFRHERIAEVWVLGDLHALLAQLRGPAA